MVSPYHSVDEKIRGAPGCAWGGEARVLEEVVEFTVSVTLTPKVMFNYLIIEGCEYTLTIWK